MTEEIRDSRHQKLGTIDTQPTGVSTIFDTHGKKLGCLVPNGNLIEAFDPHGKRVAYWDKTVDLTRDARGNRISNGNVLTTIFFN